ncbi:hypothetical protein GQ55_1G234800 [Panicum hallii var. hallii]|uniref:Uncharacterized protein n=1 Tax=Panicum hallii var. hallii TaxID=1504633 RepID=A0A2T7F6S8_9POAL|nr:hypothetical protein GQ55_1G234800 [Panicum hallii var. hallii]
MIETITQNRIHPGQKQTNTKVASLYSLQATKPQNICLIATAGSPRLWPPSGIYLFTGCWSSHRASSHATSSYFFLSLFFCQYN